MARPDSNRRGLPTTWALREMTWSVEGVSVLNEAAGIAAQRRGTTKFYWTYWGHVTRLVCGSAAFSRRLG